MDLHDQHCSDLKIQIKGKKWTWAIFKRIIEASLSNAYIIWKQCKDEEEDKFFGVKEFILPIAMEYMTPSIQKMKSHKFVDTSIRRNCVSCTARVSTHCTNCEKHYCIECFSQLLDAVVHASSSNFMKKTCSNEPCKKRTTTFCQECQDHVCPACFKKYHQAKKLQCVWMYYCLQSSYYLALKRLKSLKKKNTSENDKKHELMTWTTPESSSKTPQVRLFSSLFIIKWIFYISTLFYPQRVPLTIPVFIFFDKH